MTLFVVCHVTDSNIALLCDAPGTHWWAVGSDIVLLCHSCCFWVCQACCGWCLAIMCCGWWWPLVMVVSKVGGHCGQWWWLKKSGVVCWWQFHKDSIPPHSRKHSFQVIPGTTLAEFEFCSKFCWNHLINLAGPSAKFDTSVIPGIAWIPPDSGRNQWRTVKTSPHPPPTYKSDHQHMKITPHEWRWLLTYKMRQQQAQTKWQMAFVVCCWFKDTMWVPTTVSPLHHTTQLPPPSITPLPFCPPPSLPITLPPSLLPLHYSTPPSPITLHHSLPPSSLSNSPPSL